MPTLKGVIDAVDAIRPNPYTSAQKMSWINQLMAAIQTDVWLIDAYAAYQFTSFESDKNKDLIPLPPAYSSMWEDWLISNIHMANSEYDLYSNAAALFNEKYGAFVRWFARTYEPAQRGRVLRLRFNITDYAGPFTLFTLPETALAADVNLNIVQAEADGTITLWAGPNKTPIVSDLSVAAVGNHALGWINATEYNGSLPVDVGVTTYFTEAQAVLTMRVFVPEDVYYSERRA